ncbi:Fic family protein [Kribbella sp. CA-293567]|uniref:Fic family protein n=1 Tax=Kribbella sp. CA-293567 TaxID=3002436 RepID=UPI0022DD5366|nr:Fic family protein [Kribbella sp. CA-293567]WBQ06527.1 Fic family protein [Kribbella sp. CA-293567]
MSRQITAIWQGNPDAYGPRKYRRPCEYTAYLPDLLSAHPLDFSAELTADIADTERALAAFGGPGEHHLEQLARFLLRAEAVASSKIEGLQVNSRRLARHEAKVAAGAQGEDATADAVLGNVHAMDYAVQSVAMLDKVEVRDLVEIHRALMEHSDQPEIAGQIRTKQNWIGGSNFNPCQAAFVPPPPEHVEALLEDLCVFVNRDDLPGTIQAGLVHAQFETIHPFADGNGRTGRALIHVVLKRRGLAKDFVPPISLALATRAAAYIDGLSRFRYVGAPGSEPASSGLRDWLDLFLSATRRATADAAALQSRLTDLETGWRAALSPRKGSAAERLLPELIGHPVITAEDAMRLTGSSRSAAFTAVETFVSAGILSPVGSQQRYRLFEAAQVFQILTDYERASATESGSTRGEQPKRAVPYRQNRS